MASGKRIVNFKIDLIDKLALDAYVERKEMSKSEYCRLAVLEKLRRDMKRKQDGEEEQDSELEVIMSMLNTMNNHLHTLMESTDNSKLHGLMMGGFRTMSRGIIATNDSKRELLRAIFPDKEIWSRLAELGVK